MNKNHEINRFFTVAGYGFPENSDELSAFNENHMDFVYKGNVENIDPKRILAAANINAPKVSAVDYHKRTVLAAEIVFQLKDEWSMGHLKLQKLLYLCQNAMKMPIHATFLKQALGPYDPQLKRSLDKQFEERKWFKFQKHSFPKYLPLENCGEHREWYQRYFNSNSEQVSFIIDTFKTVNTHDVELVATIFACWNELNYTRNVLDTDELIEKLYEWSEEKRKFSEDEILKTIDWMKEKGITPTK